MPEGAVDNEYEEAERSYQQRVADALDDVRTEPVAGSLAIDLCTRQLLFVRQKVYDNLEEHYQAENYDLATYGPHPWLPVTVDDAVYECYYVDGNPDNVGDEHKKKDYDFPRGRLIALPIEQAWNDVEVGDV